MMDRRGFLKFSAITGSFAASLPAFSLLGHKSVSAQSASDYKALVCVYLYGGNDGYNTLVPYESASHAQYLSLRPEFNPSSSTGLGIPRNALLPLVFGQSNSALGLHPSFRNIQRRSDSGQVAWIQNVGNLVQPLTRFGFNAGIKPAALGSHNDQQDISMVALQESHAEGSERGWSARVMARALENGILASGDTGWAKISFAGRNRLLAAPGWSDLVLTPNQQLAIVLPDQIGPLLNQGTSSSRVLTRAYASALSSTYTDLVKVNSIFSNTGSTATGTFDAVTGGNRAGLIGQLLAVARVIEACRAQGPRRQVFFVGIGGYDTHEAQYNAHASLLTELDTGLHAFFSAMESLGLSQQVTAFTMSDFGRTLRANASHGTDHAWASHLMVMGGAVRGGLYGRAADITPSSEDIAPNDSNWVIPSTSINQYAATLAAWMGLNPTDLNAVFPDLRNFAQPNLGFMNS